MAAGVDSGLLTHICQTPSTAAAAKTANATHKWARINRLFFGTGDPPVRTRMERGLWHHADSGEHLAVPEAAELVAWHQQVARGPEHRVHLRDVARHHHGVDVGAG